MKIIKFGSLLRFVECNIEVHQNLREASANFPRIFRNINVVRDDIGPFLKRDVAKEGLLTQSRVKSYFMLFIGEWNNQYTVAAVLSWLLADLQKNERFVQYTPMKCFNNFLQSSVNARREKDENLNCSIVAEIMKLLANSSYGYQAIDRSPHTVAKYLGDEKTHGTMKNKFLGAWVI